MEHEPETDTPGHNKSLEGFLKRQESVEPNKVVLSVLKAIDHMQAAIAEAEGQARPHATEAAEIFARIDIGLAAEEARVDRLLRHYGLI